MHRVDGITDDVVALECHECGEQFDPDHEAFSDPSDQLRCPACGTGGMIPRRQATIAGRFPAEIAVPFTPVPNALMDHRAELGLDPHDIVLILALEMHHWRVGNESFPSPELLQARTGLSPSQFKRTARRLVGSGFVTRRRERKPNGNFGRSFYLLDCGWEKLAAVRERSAEGAQDEHLTKGHQ